MALHIGAAIVADVLSISLPTPGPCVCHRMTCVVDCGMLNELRGQRLACMVYCVTPTGAKAGGDLAMLNVACRGKQGTAANCLFSLFVFGV